MGPISAPEIITISQACPISPDTILDSLRQGTLPTMLLYDEVGLQLFEKITYNHNYYLTQCEIEILERHSEEIAAQIAGSTIIELGSGALRKTSLILQAVERLGIQTDYYALDLDRTELERSLRDLSDSQPFTHISLHGLHADYNDIHKFLEGHAHPVTIMWMGSSVGNFDRMEAANFLFSLKSALKSGDTILIGVDHRNDPDLIYRAYNDPEGDSEAFEMNALVHANRILQEEVFRAGQWQYIGTYDAMKGRHEANFEAQIDVKISKDLTISRGTKIRIERSYKYSKREVLELFDRSQFAMVRSWSDSQDRYSIYLGNVPLAFIRSEPSTIEPLPSLEEWFQLWKIWDTITLKMIPQDMLQSKPIDLRNPCIFYVGHIPTFLDIHLSRVTDQKYTNTAYTQIFERGIDPDVDDPSQCHAHSALPDSWPDLSELLAFRDAVRERLRRVYHSGAVLDRKVARAVFTVYEHEAMHAETLLYMLLQSDQTVAPPSASLYLPVTDPNPLPPAAWIEVADQQLVVGMDDLEGKVEGRYFGWDNEKPRREISIEKFTIQSRPITNGEYAEFLRYAQADGKRLPYPKGWTADGRVKTVFGPIELSKALNWPVTASYDEFHKYAHWKGERIPTYEELRCFIDKNSQTEMSASTPFLDVLGKAVNFMQWRPNELAACQEPQVFTGVWEWTSSPFERTPGFVTSQIYPGYSEDFFDSKHNIVLGGSWATLTRIAARSSFINWYQRNYEYSWSGCRLAKIS